MIKLVTEPWKVLSEHKNLCYQLTLQRIKRTQKGSALGYVWLVISPLLMLALYVFVFGFIFGGKFSENQTSKVQYAITIFLGLSLYQYFSEAFALSSGVIIGSTNFVKKILFPLEILPISICFSAMIRLAAILLMILLYQIVSGEFISDYLYLLPVVLAPFFMMILGLCWIVSSVTVYVRDIGNITQFLLMAILFASAIFYPIDAVPAEFWTFLKYNPFLHYVDFMRSIVIFGQPFSTSTFSWVVVFSVSIFYLGFGLFRILKGGFADVL